MLVNMKSLRGGNKPTNEEQEDIDACFEQLGKLNEMSDTKPRFEMENYLGTPDPNHVKKCVEAQSKLCIEKKYPHFAPHDGHCYNCSRQIYDKLTLQRASTDLITGCPWCSRSYCD